jgi:hypothetical protein
MKFSIEVGDLKKQFPLTTPGSNRHSLPDRMRQWNCPGRPRKQIQVSTGLSVAAGSCKKTKEQKQRPTLNQVAGSFLEKEI